MLPESIQKVSIGLRILMSLQSHSSPKRTGIFLSTLKDSRLTRKWTLADMRRLDCSIMKINDQRLANMKGNGKKCHPKRMGMKNGDSGRKKALVGGH